MLLSKHKELKAAITSLPDKEKDKLLLRLIAKDKVLTEHLHFKLLEDEHGLSERTEVLRQDIETEITALGIIKAKGAKEALVQIRKLNGRVNHHYKVTKDLYSEAELKIYLLGLVNFEFKLNVFSPYSKFTERLAVYYVKATIAVMKKYLKLHEDLQFDLREDFNQLLNKIHKSSLAPSAIELGLPNEV